MLSRVSQNKQLVRSIPRLSALYCLLLGKINAMGTFLSMKHLCLQSTWLTMMEITDVSQRKMFPQVALILPSIQSLGMETTTAVYAQRLPILKVFKVSRQNSSKNFGQTFQSKIELLPTGFYFMASLPNWDIFALLNKTKLNNRERHIQEGPTTDRPLRQRTLTKGGSIIVWLTSCLTGLDLTSTTVVHST